VIKLVCMLIALIFSIVYEIFLSKYWKSNTNVLVLCRLNLPYAVCCVELVQVVVKFSNDL